jgi:hypothetical protein
MARLLAEPPVSSRVDVATFSTLSLMRYGQIVEGRRGDLDIRYRGLSETHSPTASRGRTSVGEVRELAIYRGRNGKYTLRPEDRALAARLSPSGWFFSEAGGGRAGGESRYGADTAGVLGEIPRHLSYPREPLLLNGLLRVIWAGEAGERKKREDFLSGLHERFPEFQGYDELEMNHE